jgi:hypothetical protein
MDERARRILLDTFWRSSGWKPGSEHKTAPQDLAYAKAKGLMFDPVRWDHEVALGRLFDAFGKLSRRAVADAFLASLSSRRLDWRSALGSFAVFEHLRDHEPRAKDGHCTLCGFYLTSSEQDLNVLNFERMKWGGVRHQQVAYAALDLDLLLKDPPPPPTEDDFRIFGGLLSAIEAAPSSATAASLQACLSPHLKSTKSERDVLVALFGFCGILASPNHPGFANHFIAPADRDLPNRRFVDMPYPACWWRAPDGLNRQALKAYFGHILPP